MSPASDVILDIDAPFRCVKWNCALSNRMCLSRQTAERRSVLRVSRGASTGKVIRLFKPLHPYCGGGTCTQGAAIRALFPAYVHSHKSLIRPPPLPVIQTSPPRPPPPPTEETLVPPKPTKPSCPECGTTGRHKKGCSKPGYGARVTGEKPAAVRAAPVRRIQKPSAPGPADVLDEVAESSTANLLTLRAAIDDELKRRLAQRLDEIRDLRAAIGQESAIPPGVRSAG